MNVVPVATLVGRGLSSHCPVNGLRPAIGGETNLFATQGFALVPEVFAGEACDAIAANLVSAAGVGTRGLLSQSWCQALARQLRSHPLLAAFVPPYFVATQCTYFEKSRARNWLVSVHQDLSIPVAAQTGNSALLKWSRKEGALYVQPPDEFLERLVAVRVHIDDCDIDDGPLRVVPGSHVRGRLEPAAAVAARQTQGEVACSGSRGSVLVMRPLLLHASSKATGNSARRVLHFLFGPREIPYGLRWQHAV